MKLFTFCLLFSFSFSYAQEITPPDAVIQAFKAKYPTAGAVSWKKDKNKDYEARFLMDGKYHKADFTTNGSWQETECSLDYSDLPKGIKSQLNKKYKGYKVSEVEKVTDSTGTFYEVEIKQDKKKLDVKYSLEGEELSTQ